MKIFVSAGEVSGDQALAGILAALRPSLPDMVLCGLGGDESARQGLDPLFPMAQTAVSGIGDVLRSAFTLFRMNRAARLCLESGEGGRPDLAILVDYPGLNLRLARRARQLGIPTYYVAPPQAWAYRDAAARAARASARLAGSVVHVLFPFEKEFFAASASKVVSGHFLAEALAAASGPSRRNLLCLCPGSRLPSLGRNLPAWLKALDSAGILPGGPLAGGLEGVSVLVPRHLESEAKSMAGAALGKGKAGIAEIVTDKGRILRESRWAIAFPGTITLELALAGVPAAVIAVVDPLTLALGRRLLRGPWIGLPNLLLGRDAFPEWIGTASALRPAHAALLWSKLRASGSHGAGKSLRDLMGPATGCEIAAAECLEILERAPRSNSTAKKSRVRSKA